MGLDEDIRRDRLRDQRGPLAPVRRIFVRTEGATTKVLAVELSGQSLRDGRPTFERIVPPPGGAEWGEL